MKFYQSKLLNKFSNLSHTFTTKESGLSLKPFKSLNLAFHVGDERDIVEKNHAILADTLHYDKNKLIHMKQMHSARVHIVTDHDNFLQPPICDALITNKTQTPLMVMVADCSPILFYDEKQKVIAVAHAGRQGAFKNIVRNVIESFIHDFNSDVANIYVAIGASIGVCCYEVSDEIKKEAKNLDLGYAVASKNDSYYLNIRKILQKQLNECGIQKEHLEISQTCTCCNSNNYFSYRANNITGRFSGVVFLL